MQKLFIYFRYIRRKVIHFLMIARPPGLQGISLFQLIKMLQYDLRDNILVMSAAAMAYSLFFSLFPTLIFFLSLVAHLPVDDLQATVDGWLHNSLPESTYELINNTIGNMFEKRGAGTISIYFFVTLFSASRGILALSQAFDRMDSLLVLKSSFFKNNTKAIALFLSLFLLSIFAITSLLAGIIVLTFMAEKLSDFNISVNQYYLILCANWLIQLFLVLLVISILYRYAPTRNHNWSFFSMGSIIAGLLMLVAQVALHYYFSNFSNFNAVYGSLGAVMMLLVTLFWISFVLLFGFQLNIAIEKTVIKNNELLVKNNPLIE